MHPVLVVSHRSLLIGRILVPLLALAALIGCQTPSGPNNNGPKITPPQHPDVAEIVLSNPQVRLLAGGLNGQLANPDFETVTSNVPSDWQGCIQADSLTSSSDAQNGTRAGLLAKNGSCLFQNVVVSAGQTIGINCQAKLKQSLGWSGMGLSFANASYQKLTDAPTRTINSSNYSVYSSSGTAPSDTAFATIWAYTDGQLLFDNCTLSVSDPNPSTNLLVNPGFENGLSNWTACAANSVSLSPQSASGTQAARLVIDGCLYQEVSASVGSEYTLGCQAKQTGDRWTTIALAFFDTNWKMTSSPAQTISSTSYGPVSLKATVPAGTAHTGVVFHTQSDEALFDDCSLSSGSTPPPPPPSPSSDAQQIGRWSNLIQLPAPPIHAALLPTGKILFFEYEEDQGSDSNMRTHTWVWDVLAGGSPVMIDNPISKIFCSSHTFLPDGRLVTFGGILRARPPARPLIGGIKDTNVFDPASNTWTKIADMKRARYYPSSTLLANGEILVNGGTDDVAANYIDTAEVWQSGSSLPESNSDRYRLLSTAKFSQGWYPMSFQAPNGKVFNLGPQTEMGWLDTNGTGSWQSLGKRTDPVSNDRDFGNAVMYAPGKVVLIGGADPPTASTLTIDLNGSSPVVKQVASMSVARRQHNGVLLPDGTVAVIGGTSGPGFNNDAQALLSNELWNPNTGQFTPLASMKTKRIYHSIGILLPDARVLAAGGTGSDAPAHPDAEILTPPYLYAKDGSGNLATRPSIQSAPSTIAYGSSFNVTLDGSDAARVTLVKLGSVTHSTNFDQRLIDLNFSKSGSNLTLNAPANGNSAPPGHYMLFVLNANGVPSVAKIIKLQ